MATNDERRDNDDMHDDQRMMQDHIARIHSMEQHCIESDRRVGNMERKQDEVRETMIPALANRLGVVEGAVARLVSLPEQMAELTSYQKASRWLLVTVIAVVGVAVAVVTKVL